MTTTISLNIVNAKFDHPRLAQSREFYEVGVPEGHLPYDERCKRIRALFGDGFLAMCSGKAERREDFRFFVAARRGTRIKESDMAVSRTGLSQFKPHQALNLLLREAFAASPDYRGAGADDGKPYVVIGDPVIKQIKKDGEEYTQLRTWTPRFGQTLDGDISLNIGSHTFTEIKEGLGIKGDRETVFHRYGDVMTTRAKTKGTPYRLGNVGSARYTVPAFDVEDADINTFKRSKSHIFHEVLGCLRAHFGLALSVEVAKADVEVVHPSDKEMARHFEARMQVLASHTEALKVHDAVREPVSRAALKALADTVRKVMPLTTIAETRAMKAANIVLVPDPKRFRPAKGKAKAGDLFGQVDPYAKKPLAAQAVVADLTCSLGRAVEKASEKDETDSKEVKRIVDTVLNEILIKREVDTGRLISGAGLPDFIAFAPSAMFGKDLNCGRIVRAEHQQGTLTFSLLTLSSATAQGGVSEGLLMCVAGETVRVETDATVHPLPDVASILAAFAEMPDGGDAHAPRITPELHRAAMDLAFGPSRPDEPENVRMAREAVRNAVSRKAYRTMFPKRRDAGALESTKFRSMDTDLNKRLLAALEEIGFKIRADGLKGKAVTQALSGLLIDVNRRFYVAGDAAPVKASLVRFPSVVRVRTESGNPVPEAFFDTIIGQQQRYMRLSSRPFIVKHMREFLLRSQRDAG